MLYFNGTLSGELRAVTLVLSQIEIILFKLLQKSFYKKFVQNNRFCDKELLERKRCLIKIWVFASYSINAKETRYFNKYTLGENI